MAALDREDVPLTADQPQTPAHRRRPRPRLCLKDRQQKNEQRDRLARLARLAQFEDECTEEDEELAKAINVSDDVNSRAPLYEHRDTDDERWSDYYCARPPAAASAASDKPSSPQPVSQHQDNQSAQPASQYNHQLWYDGQPQYDKYDGQLWYGQPQYDEYDRQLWYGQLQSEGQLWDRCCLSQNQYHILLQQQIVEMSQQFGMQLDERFGAFSEQVGIQLRAFETNLSAKFLDNAKWPIWDDVNQPIERTWLNQPDVKEDVSPDIPTAAPTSELLTVVSVNSTSAPADASPNTWTAAMVVGSAVQISLPETKELEKNSQMRQRLEALQNDRGQADLRRLSVFVAPRVLSPPTIIDLHPESPVVSQASPSPKLVSSGCKPEAHDQGPTAGTVPEYSDSVPNAWHCRRQINSTLSSSDQINSSERTTSVDGASQGEISLIEAAAFDRVGVCDLSEISSLTSTVSPISSPWSTLSRSTAPTDTDSPSETGSPTISMPPGLHWGSPAHVYAKTAGFLRRQLEGAPAKKQQILSELGLTENELTEWSLSNCHGRLEKQCCAALQCLSGSLHGEPMTKQKILSHLGLTCEKLRSSSVEEYIRSCAPFSDHCSSEHVSQLESMD